MIRYIFAALALTLGIPAHAQTVTDRLDKARTEVNTAENALGRALYALDRLREAIDAEPGHAGHTMPPAPLADWVPSPSLERAAPLKAEFPIEQGLTKAWGTGAIPGIYNVDEGAFRFTCGGEGPIKADDPLLYPGKPGKSHLHKFWGAVDIDAFSTHASLSQHRDSNCNYGPYTLNRSGYWMPALLNDAGQVVNPDLVSVYYKRWRSISPFCQASSGKAAGICVGLPNAIGFIFGWDPTRPDEAGQGMSWYCVGPKGEGRGGHFGDLDAVFAAGCRAGDTLVADLIAPNCWDGKHLDAPDHRAHMAWGSYGSWGYYRCPPTHPYLIPQTENKTTWTVAGDMIAADGTSRVSLSSDAMKPGAKPGETLHADYIEAWVDEAKRMWTENCIEKGLDCSGGDLGNGLQLIGASRPKYGWVNPNRLTAIPSE